MRLKHFILNLYLWERAAEWAYLFLSFYNGFRKFSSPFTFYIIVKSHIKLLNLQQFKRNCSLILETISKQNKYTYNILHPLYALTKVVSEFCRFFQSWTFICVKATLERTRFKCVLSHCFTTNVLRVWAGSHDIADALEA